MKRIHPIRRLLLTVVGVVCLTVGVVTSFTPIPTGIPLVGLGLVILVSVSATARRWLHWGRDRFHPIDKSIALVETRVHRKVSTMLRRTRPVHRRAKAKAAIQAVEKASHSRRVRSSEKDD